ncbi:hypothetical protein ACJIZ3_003592 [Penstemon smallii]|uniref:Uncharacterized protein n=1 Tax=Penstemon smallii TaxID=265156 RepID=A0ABD3U9M3_9LAMI
MKKVLKILNIVSTNIQSTRCRQFIWIQWYQMKPHLQNAHSQPYIAALSNSSTTSSSSPTSTSSSQGTSLSQGIDESPKIRCSFSEFISSTSSPMFKSNKTKNNYIIIKLNSLINY